LTRNEFSGPVFRFGHEVAFRPTALPAALPPLGLFLLPSDFGGRKILLLFFATDGGYSANGGDGDKADLKSTLQIFLTSPLMIRYNKPREN
jgi:hypothetical protein